MCNLGLTSVLRFYLACLPSLEWGVYSRRNYFTYICISGNDKRLWLVSVGSQMRPGWPSREEAQHSLARCLLSTSESRLLGRLSEEQGHSHFIHAFLALPTHHAGNSVLMGKIAGNIVLTSYPNILFGFCEFAFPLKTWTDSSQFVIAAEAAKWQRNFKGSICKGFVQPEVWSPAPAACKAQVHPHNTTVFSSHCPARFTRN